MNRKGANPFELPPFIGGAERDRTAGLQSAILALSQLSYCPINDETAKRPPPETLRMAGMAHRA